MHGSVRLLQLLTLVTLVFGISAIPAYAQATDGELAGTVSDAAGAPVAGATVTARNTATDASGSAITGSDGRYVISGLTAGTYTVTASYVGFRRTTQVDVRVAEDTRASLDIVLQPVMLAGITVTATLREQSLQDVPFSVAAPTADDLRKRGADELEDIAANVAGFTVQNLGPGQSQPAMRGASAGQIARDQPGVKEEVGSYLDDAPISLSLYTPDLDLFDVSRVEVLRGPQGTLFGAGSAAGTVRYITNQPQLGVTSYFGQAGVSQVDGGGTGGDIKFGFNAPLGEKAAARVVAYRTQYGGFMDAVQPVFAADTISGFTTDEDVNTGDRTGVRAAILLAPSEKVTITPRVLYQRLDMDGWNRIDDFNILGNPFTTTNPTVTLGERELVTQIGEPTTDDFVLADVNLSVDLGGVNLTSISSYMFRDILVVRDAGALTSSITGGTLELPEPIYTLDSPLDDATTSKVFTQELRLAGGGDDDGFTWLLGGFFSTNQREYGQSLLVSGFDVMVAAIDPTAPVGFTEGLRAARDVLFFSDLSYDLTQFAAFGEATIAATDRLNITGGLRFYRFDEDREQIFDGIFGNDDTGTLLVSVPGETDASGVAPRAIIAYEASENVTLNAQASRGIRLGGINDPLNVPLCTPEDLVTFGGRDSWDDQTVWNYEVGAKTQFADGRASFNISAFYMDISDLQLIVTAGSCSSRLVFNVPEARSVGLEAELSATPSENFDFAISASVSDSELRSTLTSTDAGGAVSVVSGIADGNRLPSVPKFSAAAAATYRFELQQGWPAFINGSFQHVGSRITQIDDHVPGLGTVDLTTFGPDGTIGGPLSQTTFTFDPVLPSYSLVNARIGVIRGNWEIALFGNNLTDERAFLGLDRERGTLARVGYLTNQPRTFGISVRVDN
ncbi:MAG: TonB-dependent receptor [Gemmatimonadota bacterium]